MTVVTQSAIVTARVKSQTESVTVGVKYHMVNDCGVEIQKANRISDRKLKSQQIQ